MSSDERNNKSSGSSISGPLLLASAAVAALAWVCWSAAEGGAVYHAYAWAAIHPYPSVIGGMALYLCVMMRAGQWWQQSQHAAQHEDLREQFLLHQRWQHQRRLRAWLQRNPQAAAAYQQQQQAAGSSGNGGGHAPPSVSDKWGGMMGFGPQPLPAEGGDSAAGGSDAAAEASQGAVREVLQAMDFYEVLGVPWSSRALDPAALRRARKARALAVHPDKAGAAPGAALAGSRVNAAFTVLSDPATRQQYDAWLSQQS